MSDEPKVGHAFALQIPVAFDTPTRIRDLIEATGNPDAAIYAIRLWDHRQRQAATFSPANPAGVVERICGWRRKRGDLFAALQAVGLIDFADGVVTIHPWRVVATVEWMGAAGVKQDTSDAKVPMTGAERSAKWRDAKKNAGDVARDGDVTQRDGGVTVRDGTVTVVLPNNTGTYARDTRATGPETGPVARPETKEQVPVPPDGSTPAQVALIPEPPPVEKPKKRAAKAVKPPDDPQKRPDADAWTAAYKAGVPEADRVTLTQAFWVQWSATRKVEGIDRMMRSLKAILTMPRDKFPRNASPLVWVTTGFANGITASSSAPNAPTGTGGASASISAPRPEYYVAPPPKPWSAADELAACQFFTKVGGGPPRKFKLPANKTLPDGFQIPDEHLPVVPVDPVNA